MEQDMLKELEGSTILVTGATGLIGKSIINRILEKNKELSNKIQVIAYIRNVEKFKHIFRNESSQNLSYIVSDIKDIIKIEQKVDYIVHCASVTASRSFLKIPVETIKTSLIGTENILELAKEKQVKRVIFLSSMEVYGISNDDCKITEKDGVILDLSNVRNCYPESKRMCESMCISYYHQYSVPVIVLRLTQTFGPGVEYDDNRVFAEFARSIVEEKDIVLRTKGETKRSYLYTEDAVDAIFIALIKGSNGEIYNVANKNSYCSIYEMATLICQLSCNKKSKVRVDVDKDISEYGYAPTLKMNLDTSKIEKLGWKAKTELPDMFENLILYMRKIERARKWK